MAPPTVPVITATPTRITETSTPTIGLDDRLIPSPTYQEPEFCSRPASHLWPEAFYVWVNSLWRVQSNTEPQEVVSLPEAGNLLDALLVGDFIYLLRSDGLQRIALAERTVELAVSFPESRIGGSLLVSPRQDEVIFATTDGKVGLYLPASGEVETLIDREGFYRPLGYTPDSARLYLLPQAGDPEFATIISLTLASGVVSAIPVGIGHGYAALSPNSRQLAISAVRAGTSLEYGLGLLDLGHSDPETTWLSLPNPPSHIAYGLAWAPDGRGLYFLLHSGTPSNEPATSYGLWQYRLQNSGFTQVKALEDPALHLVSMHPGGEWLVLQPENARFFAFVYLPNGEVQCLPFPSGGATLVRWSS